MKKKILVITTAYPKGDSVSLMYVHTRNMYYINNGFNVTVLNFAIKESYKYDGVKVISLKEYKEIKTNFDLLISHAPNVRCHCKFIMKEYMKFKRFIFFFHGHEVLRLSESYPKNYSYIKDKNKFIDLFQDVYDTYKFLKIKKMLTKLNSISTNDVQLVFVSQWMLKQFEKNINIDINKFSCNIIYNSSGLAFQKESYKVESEKKYDFITIRSNLDGSKYCIDFINKLAKENPKYRFLIIGKGKFFEYNKMSDNITLIEQQLKHKEIIKYLNQAKIALMPTKTDAQGVMMCEMCTFGIPVITSNIFVCEKVFEGIDNVKLIKNNEIINLDNIFKNLNGHIVKTTRFNDDNTVLKEIELIDRMTQII